MPIIASLNGVTNAGWTEYARRWSRPAKAIELNIYYIPADIKTRAARSRSTT